MASGTQKVLTQVLKLVDAHDLVRRGAGGRAAAQQCSSAAAQQPTCAVAGRSAARMLCWPNAPCPSCPSLAGPNLAPLPPPQYGSVAYPKHHTQKDISDIYLFAYVSAAQPGTWEPGCWLAC